MNSALLCTDPIAAWVLTVEVDELTLGRVKTSLVGTEFAVGQVSRANALDRIRSEEAPVIVLLEWREEDVADQSRFCADLRRVAVPDRLYIVALGGPADHLALLQASEGPANDALSRPFDSELLLVSLRRALRAMRNPAVAITPHQALDEALKHGSGEVCVRAGTTVARIHIEGGHIVWANVSSSPATMESLAAHVGVQLGAEMVAAVKQECRTAGIHFMEVLVRWGVMDQERAREAVRWFVTERVKLVLELPDATALFLPRSPQPYSERLRFRASEIPPLRLPNTSSGGASCPDLPPPESRRAQALSLLALAAVVEAATRSEGATCAAVLDRGTGACLYHAGADLDTAVAWGQLGTLTALGPEADEVLASAGGSCFVTRPLRCVPSLVLFVSFSLSAVSLGLAKAAVAAIAAQGWTSTKSPSIAPESVLR